MSSVDSGRIRKRFTIASLSDGVFLSWEFFDAFSDAIAQVDYLNGASEGGPFIAVEVFDIAPLT